MKPKSKKTAIVLLFSICASLFIANFALAGYEIEITIPTSQGPLSGAPDLSTYIRYIYLFGISLVGVAALVYLIIGGLMYMLSSTVTSKEDAKKYIWGAISGLILVLASYLILYTINPNLIKLTPPKMPGSGMNIEQIEKIT